MSARDLSREQLPCLGDRLKDFEFRQLSGQVLRLTIKRFGVAQTHALRIKLREFTS